MCFTTDNYNKLEQITTLQLQSAITETVYVQIKSHSHRFLSTPKHKHVHTSTSKKRNQTLSEGETFSSCF